MNVLITGFIISTSLIVSIGAQNAFLLRQGLLHQHVLPVVLICCPGDLLLIGTGVLMFYIAWHLATYFFLG